MSLEHAKLQEGLDVLRRSIAEPPRAAIILGTGLGALAEQVEDAIVVPFDDVPHLPSATATGHAGRFVFGRWKGRPVAVQQGRIHLYEGHSLNAVTRPLRLLTELGIESLITTNASGGLNPQFLAGQVMIVRDHLNLQWCGPRLSRPGRKFVSPYDNDLASCALRIARRAGLHVSVGTYAAVTGPNYETRAECRMLRLLGADAVGMSTIPEVMIAADRELPVLALSIISNLIRPDAPLIVDGEDVVRAVQSAASQVETIVSGVISAAAP